MWFLQVVEFAILSVWTCYNSGSIIQTEVDRKTYDFLRLLPLSPMDKEIGLLVGRNLLPLGLAGLNTLIPLVCLEGARPNGPLLFYTSVPLVLIGAAWFLNTSGRDGPRHDRT